MNNKLKEPLLNLHFEGSAIHGGRMLLDDLFQFVGNFDLALERTINFLQTGSSTKAGRPFKATQILSALEIVAIHEGSFKLALDLRRDEQELLPGFDVGVQAVSELMQGFEAIEEGLPLPRTLDQGVLMALREAGQIFERGVEVVHINSPINTRTPRVKYTKKTREKIISNIRLFEQALTEVEGRLLMIDVKEDALRCRLHPSTGEAILCSFDDSMTEQVLRYMRHFTRIRGDATFDTITNKIRSIIIKDLEPIEQPTDIDIDVTLAPPSAFWEAKSFNSLALEQGVYPVEDLDRMAGEWPEDADFDSFLEAIRSVREY